MMVSSFKSDFLFLDNKMEDQQLKVRIGTMENEHFNLLKVRIGTLENEHIIDLGKWAKFWKNNLQKYQF